ncbi:undecaprenyl/decaprenyl-phosphate alpha-N-acetylglucosaminyl 1-phosphate transferase [Aquihabitans sp. G128]|uniref:glycosyltransferase family 4 protein n=1 Tax=Aquihabitans sp. G128 TaxID=2849779 RepID=UPI001C24ADE6|nr:MraY family glycosyltransferase [Aquihabitans sp. G128]QXC63169.1 undecaprenyl/decaprenyl-phosphate alpha-N-acetylglucosaminyl 1-phosphate transferase [Aquihabitans sp. G128]
MPTTSAYVVVFVVALASTFAITPLFRWAATRLGVVAMPTERAVHTTPIPYLGGVAMLFGFLVALGVAWASGGFEVMFDGASTALGVALGAVILCAVGTLDDVRDVSAPAKTAGIVFGGSVMYLLGVTLLYFRIPFVDGLIVLGPDLAPLVTVLWVVGMANAVNLIDGLDGLATGIVAIAAGSFFLYGHRLASNTPERLAVLAPENPSPLIAVIVAGICLGFLPHNFNPARIFMGDGGALMLGGLMAASTMLVGGQTSVEVSGQVFFFFAPLFIPFFVMGVPIFDTAFAIFRRARKRTGINEADKDHLHHRLMRLGHGHRRSVVILWLWTGLLSLFVLYPVYTSKGDGLVPIAVLALALVLLTFFYPGIRRVRREDEAEAVAEGAITAAAGGHEDDPEVTAP